MATNASSPTPAEEGLDPARSFIEGTLLVPRYWTNTKRLVTTLSAVDVDREGRTALHYAALEGAVDQVRPCIAEGNDPSTPDRHGYTPLHFAAQAQNAEVARVLLEAGACVDAQDEFGKTPLAVALFNVRDGEGLVVHLLLQAGASPDTKNKSGVSPRDLAERVANYDLTRFFRR